MEVFLDLPISVSLEFLFVHMICLFAKKLWMHHSSDAVSFDFDSDLIWREFPKYVWMYVVCCMLYFLLFESCVCSET